MDFIIDLLISADCKGDSYNSILVIINWLTKMVHYKLVKSYDWYIESSKNNH